MKYILVIDQGTSSTRSIIFNEKAEIVSIAQKEFKQYYPNNGWVNHDANEIWLSVLTTMTEAIFDANISVKDIVSIGITNQRETTVIWDKDTGKPISHAIVWQSRQTQEMCDNLKKQDLETTIKDKTGLVLDPYFSATKIKWLLDHIPNARKDAEDGKLMFGTIDTWLIYKLTGGQHVTDHTNASRTMLFNIQTLTWDDTLLEIFDIPKSLLPNIQSSASVFGKSDSTITFGHSIPITGVAGDQQAALFGHQAILPGTVKNTYGTGCFILMNTGNRPVSSSQGLLTTVAWHLHGKTTYALEGSVFVAGSAIQWLRDGLKIIDDAKQTESMISTLDNNEGVYFVPAFVGLGTPYWDSQAKGSIYGLTRATDQRHIVRAALESIAYQSMDVIDVMKQESMMNTKALKVDGGASSNDMLMQFQADILDTQVIRPEVTETTALGAFYFAALGIGLYNEHDLKDIHASVTIFNPSMSDAIREKNILGWKKAIQRTKTK